MKAMVLAAGLGTRMRPLTLLRAKPVLPVLNRPLLHWTLELLARHGVTEVVINLHHKPSTVVRAVGDGRAFGLKVAWSREARILGTGGGPRRVRDLLGDEPFFLVNGDVIFDFDLTDLWRRHRAAGARATLALVANPDPRRYSSIVTGAGGWVRALARLPRPARGQSSLFTGVHVVEPSVLEQLHEGPSDIVRDLYAPLVDEGEDVLGLRVKGAWYDLGSPALYLRSQMKMLSTGFRGLRRGPLIHPAARIHPRARIARSIVGAATVVGEGAEVTGSVLWEGVRVGAGARVRGSILATGTRVEPRALVENLIMLPAAGLRGDDIPGRTRRGQRLVEVA
jgi:NDP-sugar pyrophosphorylase family protein